MYVYDIEEEGRLSDYWVISSNNITITGSEPIYLSLETTCPISSSVITPTDLVSIMTVSKLYFITCDNYYQNCNADKYLNSNTNCMTAAQGGN